MFPPLLVYAHILRHYLAYRWIVEQCFLYLRGSLAKQISVAYRFGSIVSKSAQFLHGLLLLLVNVDVYILTISLEINIHCHWTSLMLFIQWMTDIIFHSKIIIIVNLVEH